jgi:TolA-binding protein
MSDSPQPAADDRIFVSDGLDADLFWAKHRRSIIFGAVVVLLVLGGVAAWFVNAHNTKEAAQRAFATAGNPEAWREVIAKYPTSQPAGNAYFLLAESLREQGNFQESTAMYQKFLEVFPEHGLAGGARLGLAENLAAEGKTDEALAALKEVQTESASSYAAPFAALLEGRIYLRDGKLQEARKAFLTLVSTYQKSPAAQVAHAQIDQLSLILPPEATDKPAQ